MNQSEEEKQPNHIKIPEFDKFANQTGEFLRYMLKYQDDADLHKLFHTVYEAFCSQDTMYQKDPNILVCIPVAGHQESDNIYHALTCFTRQSLDPSLFEIFLLVNAPPKHHNNQEYTKTIEEITKFQAEYPHIRLKVADVCLPEKYCDIGIIRGLLTDAAIATHQQHYDLLICSQDADLVKMHSRYLETGVHTIKKDDDILFLGGDIEYPPEFYLEHPEYFLKARFEHFVHALSRNPRGPTSGANSIFQASGYVGKGYENTFGKGGEDFGLAKEILKFEYHDEAYKYGKKVFRIISHHRRLDYILKNEGNNLNTHDFWFQKNEEGESQLRTFGPDDEYRYKQPQNGQPRFIHLQHILKIPPLWDDFLAIFIQDLLKNDYLPTPDIFISPANLEKIVGEELHLMPQIQDAFYHPKKNIVSEKIGGTLLSKGSTLPNKDDPLRRVFFYLGIKEYIYDFKIFKDPAEVYWSIRILQADKLKLGLYKYLQRALS